MFALIAPIAGVMMLIFMYLVVMGKSDDLNFLAFLISGAAMFLFTRMMLQGAGNAVVEDREHYKILRYIYIAPVPFVVQIAGRMAVKFGIALIGCAATLIACHLILNIPLRGEGILWGRFLGSMTLGLIGVSLIAWMLANTMLLIDRMGWVWAEGISGLMFLASGAIIPLAMLPAPLVWFGRSLPMTYWVDLWRTALYDNPTLAQPEIAIGSLWLWLWLSVIAWTIIASFWSRLCHYYAREYGMIEKETFY
jgi:ABC-2 type transport system permease protein